LYQKNLTLEHKGSVNKNKKIEITSCILSDHNGIKLEINNKKLQKISEDGAANNTLLNDQWITKKIGGKLKIPRFK
jgi:hypothetical protein